MSTSEPNTPIDYAVRPKRQKDGLFAEWFVVFAAMNIVAAGVLLIANGTALVLLLGTGLSSKFGWRDVPMQWLIQFTFAFVSEAMIIGGAVGSLWKKPGARRLIQAGLIGELLVVATVLVSNFQILQALFTVHGLIFAALVLARAGYAAFFLVVYGNIRADFYFGDHLSIPATDVLPIASSVPLPKPPPGNFRVSGIEIATGRAVEFTSKAPTTELATKSALARGLEPGSLKVLPIDLEG